MRVVRVDRILLQTLEAPPLGMACWCVYSRFAGDVQDLNVLRHSPSIRELASVTSTAATRLFSLAASVVTTDAGMASTPALRSDTPTQVSSQSKLAGFRFSAGE